MQLNKDRDYFKVEEHPGGTLHEPRYSMSSAEI